MKFNYNTKSLVVAVLIIIAILIAIIWSMPQKNVHVSGINTELESEKISPLALKEETAPLDKNLILITDQENHRVIEIDKKTKEITWQYGCQTTYSNGRCKVGNLINELYLPASAVYNENNVIIADKGNNRILKINKENNDIVWVFDNLREPTFAIQMKNGDMLITDSLNNRVIEVDKNSKIVWQYGCSRKTAADKCAPGNKTDELNFPNSAIELGENVLIVDKGNNRILLVSKSKEILFEYKGELSFPHSADYKEIYLIPSTNQNKVILYNPETKQIVKEFLNLNHPTFAKFTKNTYLITDSFNNRIIELDNNGNIVWYYGDCLFKDGKMQVPCKLGTEKNQLFKPTMAVFN